MRTHRHKLIRFALLAMLLVSILGVGAAAAKIMRHKASIGEEYTCHFGRYGVVMIGWKSGRSAYIIVNGKKYSAYGGSDFFQADDADISVEFGPDFDFFYYKDVRSDHCKHRLLYR